LEGFLLAYVRAADITGGPLFRTANRKTKTLTGNAMTRIAICRMMKRRLKAAGLPAYFSPHSFRVTTVTDPLEQNVPLDDGQPYCLL
jgi:integrase